MFKVLIYPFQGPRGKRGAEGPSGESGPKVNLAAFKKASKSSLILILLEWIYYVQKPYCYLYPISVVCCLVGLY